MIRIYKKIKETTETNKLHGGFINIFFPLIIFIVSQCAHFFSIAISNLDVKPFSNTCSQFNKAFMNANVHFMTMYVILRTFMYSASKSILKAKFVKFWEIFFSNFHSSKFFRRKKLLFHYIFQYENVYSHRHVGRVV